MIRLFDRLRIALTLSPALLLLQIWILANSSNNLIQTFGITKLLALVLATSLLEAYIIVSSASFAMQIWNKNYK